jgi:hypothetical protein
MFRRRWVLVLKTTTPLYVGFGMHCRDRFQVDRPSVFDVASGQAGVNKQEGGHCAGSVRHSDANRTGGPHEGFGRSSLFLGVPQGVRNGAPQDAAARTLFEEEMLRRLAFADARVTTLEAQNVAMAGRLDGEAIKMGGVTFQSLQDCQTWVMNNICPADFYEFYDAISLLEQHKDTTIPYTQIADMDTKTQKLGLTVTSHRVINSFSREVPLIFMTGAASADKPLTRIKTPKEWDLGDGSTGLKNEISTFLDGSVEGMGQRIDNRFHGQSSYSARRVATDCLHASRDFITEMNVFISFFYSEMTHSGVGKEEESWALTLKMISVVFTQLKLGRAIAQGAADVPAEDTGRRIGLVLGGTLRAHKLMREFIAAKFRRHPKIAPCLMLRLFTTRPLPSIMKGVQAEVSILIKTGKATQVTAEAALRLAKTAKQSCPEEAAVPRKRRKLEKESATRVDSTPEAATLKVASSKAALGDVHTGYAKVSSVRRWRASVLSDGYPWWSLVAHAMDASIELIVLKHSLSLNLLSCISESQAVVDLSTNVNALARREQAVQALLDSSSDIVMIDGDPPEAQSEFWKGAALKLILSTNKLVGRRHTSTTTPQGWKHGRCEVEHALVGDVSKGSFFVHYWTRTSGEVGSLEVNNSVRRQDLRSVMKPGVYGRISEERLL